MDLTRVRSVSTSVARAARPAAVADTHVRGFLPWNAPVAHRSVDSSHRHHGLLHRWALAVVVSRASADHLDLADSCLAAVSQSQEPCPPVTTARGLPYTASLRSFKARASHRLATMPRLKNAETTP
jgi:hypothetical protein